MIALDHPGGAYDATYVFSAEQQEEIQKIYQKYASRNGNKKARSEEDEKMERLRRLDHSVTRAGIIAALLAGICGAAIHGIGIALIQRETMFVLGAVIAIFGLALFLVSYPVYCFVIKKQRRKVEAQILSLCRELMK